MIVFTTLNIQSPFSTNPVVRIVCKQESLRSEKCEGFLFYGCLSQFDNHAHLISLEQNTKTAFLTLFT